MNKLLRTKIDLAVFGIISAFELFVCSGRRDCGRRWNCKDISVRLSSHKQRPQT